MYERCKQASPQKRDVKSMQDVLIAIVFLLMIVAPCVVASAVGRVDG